MNKNGFLFQGKFEVDKTDYIKINLDIAIVLKDSTFQVNLPIM